MFTLSFAIILSSSFQYQDIICLTNLDEWWVTSLHLPLVTFSYEHFSSVSLPYAYKELAVNICNGNSFLSFKALLKFLFGYRSKKFKLPNWNLAKVKFTIYKYFISCLSHQYCFHFFPFVLSNLSVSSLYLGDKLFSVKTVIFSVCTVPNTIAL